MPRQVKLPRSAIPSLLLLVVIGPLTILSTHRNANATFSNVFASVTFQGSYSSYYFDSNSTITTTAAAATAKQSHASEPSSSNLATSNHPGDLSQISKKRRNDVNKPNLILHIGPSKTATTTIQRLLAQKGKLLREQDNYHPLGFQINAVGEVAQNASSVIYNKFMKRQWSCWNDTLLPKGELQQELSTTTTTTTTTIDGHSYNTQLLLPLIRTEPCWIKLTERLDDLCATKSSIIISDEAMSHGAKRFMYKNTTNDVNLQQLRLFAHELQERWNVHIVIVYRRYYEWILSAFKELNSKILYNRSRRKWPHKGGNILRHAWPEISSWMEKPDSIVNQFHYQYPDRTKKLWGDVAGFENIHIVNFHSPRGGDDDPNGLFRHFICDIVPNATRTCQDISNSNQEVHANARVVDTTMYDHIVCEAQERFPTIRKTTVDSTTTTNVTKASEILLSTRLGAAKLLREYFEGMGRSWIDLPLNCPTTTELEGLLNLSLSKEKELLPDFFRDREDEHRLSFWRVANEKKAYCSVDLESLFRNKASWEDVFESFSKR